MIHGTIVDNWTTFNLFFLEAEKYRLMVKSFTTVALGNIARVQICGKFSRHNEKINT
jgi:hypothetical protein